MKYLTISKMCLPRCYDDIVAVLQKEVLTIILQGKLE